MRPDSRCSPRSRDLGSRSGERRRTAPRRPGHETKDEAPLRVQLVGSRGGHFLRRRGQRVDGRRLLPSLPEFTSSRADESASHPPSARSASRSASRIGVRSARKANSLCLANLSCCARVSSRLVPMAGGHRSNSSELRVSGRLPASPRSLVALPQVTAGGCAVGMMLWNLLSDGSFTAMHTTVWSSLWGASSTKRSRSASTFSSVVRADAGARKSDC